MNNVVTVTNSVKDDALMWAKENCPGYITNVYHTVPRRNEFDPVLYDFVFSINAQEDMIAFKLKWCR